MISLIGICIFLGTCLLVEYIRQNDVSYSTSWISTYLTGPYSWIEDLGFCALAVALFLYPAHNLPGYVLDVSGICVFLSMASRRFLPDFISNPALVTKIHVTVSGLAFILAFLGLVLTHSKWAILVLVLTVICDLGVYMTASTDTPKQQIVEKVTALGIGLAAIVGILV